MKMQEKKYHIQHLTSDWKSECCEKSRSQMPLKMLGVCSSLQDQQFWLLDHSISSSYERVMIEIRNTKSRTFSADFQIWCSSSYEKLEGRETIWGGKMRGKIVQILEGHQTANVWPACATRGQRGALAVWHTWPPLAWLLAEQPPRAPLAFFSRIRASELRIRIRFRITNCDSLTHDDDY